MNLARLFTRGSAPTPQANGGESGLGAILNRTIQAVSMALHIRQANRWRDQLNPLRGLTIARVVSLIEAGERGEYADLQWTYRTLEKRDPTTMALLARYDAGLLKLDWQIKTMDPDEWPEGATEEMAEQQESALRNLYEGIDNIREGIAALIGARFRGFAVVEKQYSPDGDLVHLEPVPQWYWVRDGINGEWQYNKNANGGTYRGEDVSQWKEKLIVREVARPVNELGLLNFVLKNLGKKDWAAFIETYGITPLFLEGPAGATKTQEDAFVEVANKIISNARGYLPNGSKIHTVDAAARGTNPFKEFMNELQDEVILAATGQKLTFTSESGSGTLAGGAHQDAWDSIVIAEAMLVSEDFNKSIDSPFLDDKFPGQPHLCYMELCAYEETDAKDLVDQISKLTSAGYNVLPGQVEEKTGLKLATIGDNISLPEFKIQAEAYGVAVRAGAITPNLKDEEHFRKVAGLPPVGPEVRRSWTEDPTRQPITIQDAPPAPGPGAPAPAAPAPGGRVPPQLRNRGEQPTLEANSAQVLGSSLAADLQPVGRRLAAIQQITDPDIKRAKLEEFRRDLDSMKADIQRDPAAARALEQITAAALVNGLDQTR